MVFDGFFKKLTAQKPCRRVFEGAAGFYRSRNSLFLFPDLYLVPGAPDQLKRLLKCRWFSRHAVHLERKVEVISAEAYLFQCSTHLFQAHLAAADDAAPAHMHLLYSSLCSV